MRRLPLVLVLAGACRPAPVTPPAEVVREFYRTYIAAEVTGAPTEAQLARLTPYLSDTLTALLRAARLEREADVKAAPAEKPAFAEGDLFSSLFEGPTEVAVAAKDTTASPRRYAVRLTYAGADAPFTWSDEVLVGREHGRWVITDIEYGGTWDFATRGTLRQGLEQALAGE